MSLNINDVDAALRAAILANNAQGSAVLAALGGSFVYRYRSVPQGVFPPYVVYSHLPQSMQVHDGPREHWDIAYMVQGVAGDSSTAWALEHLAGEALLVPGAIAPTGYHVYAVTRTQIMEFEQSVAGSPVHRNGALYRVRLDKNS